MCELSTSCGFFGQQEPMPDLDRRPYRNGFLTGVNRICRELVHCRIKSKNHWKFAGDPTTLLGLPYRKRTGRSAVR